jgi:hypothetical protein
LHLRLAGLRVPETRHQLEIASVRIGDAGAGERRYGLPAAYRPVLIDEENISSAATGATL